MSAIVFDGKEFASNKEEELRKKGLNPKLASILVGEDPASKIYLNLKKKAAERVEAIVEIHKFPESANPKDIIALIKKLNLDDSTHGIMIQLPLPRSLKLEAKRLIDAIDSKKDVDGLRENSFFVPATVKAILQIIELATSDKRKVTRKRVVVVGVKGEVGRRLIRELKKREYRVSGYDIETKDLQAKTKDADILISVTGVPGLIKADMVRGGAVVIDVGSPKGDVNFAEVSKKASFITPVPGGVGPVTISCLLENLVEAVLRFTTYP